LTIDPVFVFATYLDGSHAGEQITSTTTDATGNIYVTGFTTSTDFPVTNSANPLCSVCVDAADNDEAFVSKLDPTGHTLLYSTFLGGSQRHSGCPPVELPALPPQSPPANPPPSRSASRRKASPARSPSAAPIFRNMPPAPSTLPLPR
jgi:hypothetical protein